MCISKILMEGCSLIVTLQFLSQIKYLKYFLKKYHN